MRIHLLMTCLLLALNIGRPGYAQSTSDTLSLFVDGICGMCETRIEKAARQVAGVTTAEWNIDSRILTVFTDSEDFDEDQIHWAVTGAGHDTRKYLASDEAYAQLHDCCKYRDPAVVAAHRPAGQTFELFVDGICGMCKTRIEKAARQVAGVTAAEWNVDSRILTVFTDSEDFDEDQIHWAVTGAGHDTRKYLASDEAYAQLHDCCRYRDPAVVAAHQPQRPAAVSGRILVEENGRPQPFPGVNIYWLGGTAGTVTDDQGRFELPRPAGADRLITSYVGFYSDTLDLTNETTVEITLTPGTTLEAVEVIYRRKSIEVSFLDPINTQQISSRELLKAACCNLAESFETNPAVDVSFTDAVTGARQIEMLGLAGPYVQITRENMPDIRGLSSIYGLTYIPGPWIEGIQLAKGPGSVVNGFESMTGQINVELKKPEESERFYLNLYGNEGGRLEANANARIRLSDQWSTGILLHGNRQQEANDRNNDGFLDMPTGDSWTAANRWKYIGDEWRGQVGVKVTRFDKTSGQVGFDPEEGPGTSRLWGANLLTQRVEGWGKIGKVFPGRPGASIGLQVAGVLHDQDATFGYDRYDADQQSLYANLIYQDMIGSPVHQLKTGLSFQWDRFDEWLAARNFKRNETAPGAYVEYTFQPNDQFTAVAGLRGDHHNQFGFFLTPRLHLRYALQEHSVLRASLGQGRRTASIIAENIGALASSRAFVIGGGNRNTPYGLDQEISWNAGLNLRQTFIVQQRELILTLDAYHTRFEQQIIVDYDQSPREIHFYNLDGRSYSNTLQGQVDFALLSNLDLRVAYRFNDVRVAFRQSVLERPFVARHRAFANLAYETDNRWAFDATVNWQGSKRIPSTTANPVEYQLPGRSPDFWVVNGQISKSWQEKLDLYVGVENLFNFVQENPIIGADDPFGTYFDASLVWGPIFGRMVYAGVRYTVE